MKLEAEETTMTTTAAPTPPTRGKGSWKKREPSNPNLIPLGTPRKLTAAAPPPPSPSASSTTSFASCKSGFSDSKEKGEAESEAKTELDKIYGPVDLSIERPCKVNGENYQIRVMIYDQLFIGRSPTLIEATERCCLKAVKYIKQHKLGPFARETATKKDRRRRRKGKKPNAPSSKSKKRGASGEKGVEWDPESENFDFRNIPIKNAIMMLNEMFPPPKAPQYKVLSQTGSPNNPTFSMMCNINNKSYVGEGKSKKEAKLVCSQKAIEVLCGYKRFETRSVPEKSNPRANCDLDDWMELEGKNPVSILNELYPGIQYQLLSTTGPSHAPNFIIKAMLNNMSFEGSGKSKKDAKLNASKALLVHLHKVGFDPMTGDMMSTRENTDAAADGHTFADQISQLVYSKYQELFGTTTYSKRRVMAAIVMTETCESPIVIAVTSGTKCINGEQISLEGCVINDSHAEIVARRCLVLYLYSQLQRLADKDADSIFYRLDGNARCRLRDGIEFHLFITTSPCGDARIFSLHESSNSSKAKSKDKSTKEESAARSKLQDENNNDPVVPEVLEPSKNGNSSEVQDVKESEDIIISSAETNLSKESCPETVVIESVNGGPAKVVECIEPDDQAKTIQSVDENNNAPTDYEDKLTRADNRIRADETDEIKPTEENPSSDINSNGIDSIRESASSVSLAETENSVPGQPTAEKKSNDSSRGMLRSKIECGMGTVPISPKIQIQTWDGVMSGDRLLTMACSDKILRWNILGVQGAVLTHMVNPIYLTSITVGSKFHPGHMKRAVYDRVQPHMKDLPEGYKVNNANLYATTSLETRQATKAHDYSVNWVVDHGQPEIVNGSTGKTINDSVSRLSKKMLFKKFLDINGCILKLPFRSPCRYSEVKQMALDYQAAKSELNLALKEAGCGVWIDKPIEQDQFSL